MADSYGRINSAGAYSIGAATPVKVPTTDATKRHGIRVQNTSAASYLYAVVVPGGDTSPTLTTMVTDGKHSAYIPPQSTWEDGCSENCDVYLLSSSGTVVAYVQEILIA